MTYIQLSISSLFTISEKKKKKKKNLTRQKKIINQNISVSVSKEGYIKTESGYPWHINYII